jgi:hypothetical protein
MRVLYIGHRLRTGIRVDWFRVLADLKAHGVSLRGIRRQIQIPETTLNYYKQGGEPKHANGEVLIAFWCQVTNREREQLPMEQAGLSAAEVNRR